MNIKKIKPGDDVENELYNLDTNEFVCSNHIDEEFIKNQILKNGKEGKCNYCNKTLKVVELNDVLNLIIIGIKIQFEDPVNSRYLNKEGEHGYDGNTFDFNELWQDHLFDSLRIKKGLLSADIYKYLDNSSIYCCKNEFGSEEEFLQDTWDHFKEIVKHKARFVFYTKNLFKGYRTVDPFLILENVQNFIIKFGLFCELTVDTVLYRCRQHISGDEIKGAENMASTPFDKSKKNGRMNPAGISMFYCSRSMELTIIEVVDSKNKDQLFFTTAIFRNKSKLKLVDLTNVPEQGSIFDESNNKDIDTILFLKEFLIDISKRIDDEDSIIEYVPTQIVTEYIKFNQELNVDGIIYPSSKDKIHNNIVLFFDHEESMENLNFSKSSIKTERIKLP